MTDTQDKLELVQLEVFQSMMSDAQHSVELLQRLMITSLASLFSAGYSIGFLITDQKDNPEEVAWLFDIIDEEGVIQERFLINRVLDFIEGMNERINGLIATNPHFLNKQYLVGVGVEQALKEFNEMDKVTQ